MMVFHTIRSVRRLMEQIKYNLAFRWFVDFSNFEGRDHLTSITNRKSASRPGSCVSLLRTGAGSASRAQTSEECFGWMKTMVGLRKSRFIGRGKLDSQLVLTFAVFNLGRMGNLSASTVARYGTVTSGTGGRLSAPERGGPGC